MEPRGYNRLIYLYMWNTLPNYILLITNHKANQGCPYQQKDKNLLLVETIKTTTFVTKTTGN